MMRRRGPIILRTRRVFGCGVAVVAGIALAVGTVAASAASTTPVARVAVAWANKHRPPHASGEFVFCYSAGPDTALCRILYDGSTSAADCEKDIFVSLTDLKVERQLGSGCYRMP